MHQNRPHGRRLPHGSSTEGDGDTGSGDMGSADVDPAWLPPVVFRAVGSRRSPCGPPAGRWWTRCTAN
ncbi:hypothetical protein WJ438_10110 [Streptomyces sp. GD-15H]|uniref:hypothetical protein n=1 Tax=Streptomyces sp. GD-15H TaxID=3129112 RepID=UPI0032452086